MEGEIEWNCMYRATLTSRMNLGVRKEVQALCRINSVSLGQSPHLCLLSSFLLHFSCSEGNDVPFRTTSNAVSLIHFILIFLLPVEWLPTKSLDFSLILSSATRCSLPVPPTSHARPCLSYAGSDLPISPGHPSNLSLFYLHIYHHVTTGESKRDF